MSLLRDGAACTEAPFTVVAAGWLGVGATERAVLTALMVVGEEERGSHDKILYAIVPSSATRWSACVGCRSAGLTNYGSRALDARSGAKQSWDICAQQFSMGDEDLKGDKPPMHLLLVSIYCGKQFAVPSS